jgi:hypothetical protein
MQDLVNETFPVRGSVDGGFYNSCIGALTRDAEGTVSLMTPQLTESFAANECTINN